MYNILPTHGISQLAGTCTDTKEIIWPKRHENSYKCTLHLERSKTKKNLWDPRLKFICPFGQTFFYCISTCFSHMWVGWQQGKQWLIGCSSYIKPLSATYKVPFSMYGNFFEIYCSTFLWNIQKDFNFHILWAMVHLKSNVDF